LIEKLSADKITWDPEKEKWKIRDYRIRKIGDMSETLSYGSELDTTLNLKPKDFENTYKLFETFTLPELNEYIDLLISRGSDGLEVYLIEKYTRFTQPFAMMILT